MLKIIFTIPFSVFLGIEVRFPVLNLLFIHLVYLIKHPELYQWFFFLQEVDLVGPLKVSEQRAKVADFTNCLEVSKFGIITGIKSLDRNMFLYARVFSWKVIIEFSLLKTWNFTTYCIIGSMLSHFHSCSSIKPTKWLHLT